MSFATDIGTGATIGWGTSTFTAEIVTISWDGIERDFIDASHLGSTNGKEFLIGDLYDPGTLTIEVHLGIDATHTPPITGALETMTVTLPNATTMSALGALQSYTVGIPLEDKMTATMVMKMSGDITFPA